LTKSLTYIINKLGGYILPEEFSIPIHSETTEIENPFEAKAIVCIAHYLLRNKYFQESYREISANIFPFSEPTMFYYLRNNLIKEIRRLNNLNENAIFLGQLRNIQIPTYREFLEYLPKLPMHKVGVTYITQEEDMEKEQKPMVGNHSVTGKYGSIPGNIGRQQANDTHAGTDLVSTSRSVQAAKSGIIKFAGRHPDGISTATGTLIVIKYIDGNYGLYGHMDPNDLNVTAGSIVSVGTLLGKYFNGRMGVSTGGHLHYQEFTNITPPTLENSIARYFNGTGYFYDTSTIPTNRKVTSSAGVMLEVVEPIWNEYKE
jgi:murein DD-endopeptidase MepM/ murein hydrolase activator NlpD